MAYRIEAGRRPRGTSRAGRVTLIVILLALLIGARSVASYVIDIEWWKELGQFNTWFNLLTYSLAPVAAATLSVPTFTFNFAANVLARSG